MVAMFVKLTDRKNMSNLYRDPPMHASYQVFVHFAQSFQRRRFLEIDQPETKMAAIFVNGSERHDQS